MTTTAHTKSRSRLHHVWKEWVRPIAVVFLLIFGVRTSVADWHHVPTGSMEPNILPGDRILVNKAAYDLKIPLAGWTIAQRAQPQRGDIIVCFAPDDSTRLVKRVIGLPGDTIAMIDGQLQINRVDALYRPAATTDAIETERPVLMLEETIEDAAHLIMHRTGANLSSRSFEARQIPPDRFLVLGDNRDNSRDSRAFGFVERDRISGRVWGTTFSITPGGGVRWQRLLRSIE